MLKDLGVVIMAIVTLGMFLVVWPLMAIVGLVMCLVGAEEV